MTLDIRSLKTDYTNKEPNQTVITLAIYFQLLKSSGVYKCLSARVTD